MKLLLAGALALTLCPNGLALQSQCKLGELADGEFERPVMNSAGLKRLSELRGRPVIVEYWGRGNWGAPEYIGDVLDWKSRFGDDLEVVFLELQGGTEEQVEAAVLKNKWISAPAMWSTEAVLNTGLKGTPQLALLGCSGEVLFLAEAPTWGMGLENRVMDEIEALIEAQVALRREGPEEAPKAVKKAYAQFSKGDLGAALASADALASSDDAQVAEAARIMSADFEGRLAERLARAEWWLEAGRLRYAEEALAGLEDISSARPALEEQRARVAARLASDELAAEREAAEALAKIEKKLAAKGTKSANLKALARLAKKHPGTKSAALAEHWLRLSEVEIGAAQ